MLGRRSIFDCLSLIYLMLIPVGLLCIISGFRAIYFLKTMPLVPLENSEKGDHVKVTALRVVEVIDTEGHINGLDTIVKNTQNIIIWQRLKKLRANASYSKLHQIRIK